MKKSRKKKEIQPEIKRELQQSISRKFGKRPENKADCEEISAEILQQVRELLSYMTLQRFFDLSTESIKYTPSKNTLDILSAYCGFSDFFHFRESVGKDELEAFFQDEKDTTKNYWQKSEELCQQITDSSELLVRTHYDLMQYPKARTFFLEHHPMRDMLGSVYSQYFLEYLKYNTSAEAKTFAYGFLFHGAFLTQNQELLDMYYHQLQKTTLISDVYLIPCGLKFGCELLYADRIGDEGLFQERFQEMKKARIAYAEDSKQSICGFEYTVLESLIFTNRKEEIRFLMDNTIRQVFQKTPDEGFVPFERKETHNQVWYILCAICYHKIGEESKRDGYLKQVQLENLGIGWKNYYSILYYLLLLEISEPRERKVNLLKVSKLIKESNFCYFQDQIERFII